MMTALKDDTRNPSGLSHPPILNGLSDVMDDYDVFFLDVWGVLYDGLAPYPTTLETLKALKANDKTVLLLSNSPCLSSHVARTKMSPIGVTPDMYDFFLTSGDASNTYIKANFSGQKVYSFWKDEDVSALDNTHTTRVFNIREADFMYGSLLPHGASLADFEDILALALTKDLPFVCGNPDRVVGVGDDIFYCVGSLAQVYEEMGGTVIWYGKPYADVYNQAWEMVGKPEKSRILAIGDSLITDVAGATNFGCDVLWNATGIHWEELKCQTAQHSIDPSRIKQALVGHATPTALLEGFKL